MLHVKTLVIEFRNVKSKINFMSGSGKTYLNTYDHPSNEQLDMTTPLGPRSLSTSESCNQMGTVFEEMSSWACFNKTSRGEDNILDQIYKIQFYHDDFFFHVIF